MLPLLPANAGPCPYKATSPTNCLSSPGGVSPPTAGAPFACSVQAPANSRGLLLHHKGAPQLSFGSSPYLFLMEEGNPTWNISARLRHTYAVCDVGFAS
jgi:hypothetical protein